MAERLLEEASTAPVQPVKPEHAATRSPSQHERLHSLDLQRGLTIAGMIFADEIGEAYPHLNHSPWNGITMADYIMPWFLFMVGTSMAFSLRKFRATARARKEGAKYVLIRTAKLFVLGVLIQGGGWPGDYTYGYNLYSMRFCGILQRIAFGYVIVAMCEIFLPLCAGSQLPAQPGLLDGNSGDAETATQDRMDPEEDESAFFTAPIVAHLSVFRRHALKWIAAIVFTGIYLALLYGTLVPTWTIQNCKDNCIVECNVRGQITPACSATGYYDRLIFGQNRCQGWMSERLPDCSSCSPGKKIYSTGAECKIDNAPNWCGAPLYDPEGALASLNAVISVWLGLHFGHVLKHPGARFTQHGPRLWHWTVLSAILIGTGWAIDAAGHQMNKQVWTVSYALYMAGTCGAFLVFWYLIVDLPWGQNRNLARRIQLTVGVCTSPLRWMGMNAILVFTWHGLATAVLNVVYWQSTDSGERHNLVGEIQENVFDALHNSWHQLLFVLCKIACFAAACGYCARIGYFWKL